MNEKLELHSSFFINLDPEFDSLSLSLNSPSLHTHCHNCRASILAALIVELSLLIVPNRNHYHSYFELSHWNLKPQRKKKKETQRRRRRITQREDQEFEDFVPEEAMVFFFNIISFDFNKLRDTSLFRRYTLLLPSP